MGPSVVSRITRPDPCGGGEGGNGTEGISREGGVRGSSTRGSPAHAVQTKAPPTTIRRPDPTRRDLSHEPGPGSIPNPTPPMHGAPDGHRGCRGATGGPASNLVG